MKTCIVVSLIDFFVLITPHSALAWFARYVLFDNIQWSPDSQAIVFEGDCVDEGNGCGPVSLFQYDLPTQRLTHITPEIDSYMISPSQKWLVFADFYGLYILELDHDGHQRGQPFQVLFHPLIHEEERWILIGFSQDESTFVYGLGDRYYEVSLPSTVTQDIQTLPVAEMTGEFSCAEYTSATRYYEIPRGEIRQKGELIPRTDKCQDDESGKNTLLGEFDQFHVSLVPEWVSSSLSQPCWPNPPVLNRTTRQNFPYSIQFVSGRGDVAFDRLMEYAEYVDSFELRVRLEHEPSHDQYRICWGHFSTKTEANTALVCLQKQFQLDGQVVKQEYALNGTKTPQVSTYSLKSFGRVISPDETKTAYIKDFGDMSIHYRMEIWIMYHGKYYEEKVVESITND